MCCGGWRSNSQPLSLPAMSGLNFGTHVQDIGIRLLVIPIVGTGMGAVAERQT